MEVASVKGDVVLLLYHPAEEAADVGQQFTVLELPEKANGLVVQVISNDSLDYIGLQQELIQQILEQQIAELQIPLNRERGMGEIRKLKLATAKIRKRISQGSWETWDGWIPTRSVAIARIGAEDLLGNVLPKPTYPLSSFARFNGTPIVLDGPRLNMVNVITGVKGSGKSHLAKHFVLTLGSQGVPCIIFDINGEYVGLPGAQVFSWGTNFLPRLAEVGYGALEMMVKTLYPLQPGSPSESVFETRLPNIFNERKQLCERQGRSFEIDIAYLRAQTWTNDQFVAGAIDRRLGMMESMNLFWSRNTGQQDTTNLTDSYTAACDGRPVVFDMRGLGNNMQRALVKSMTGLLEDICEAETRSSAGRYPFVFFEEAHFYVSESAIMNLITRGRHIGIASVFVTNTPQHLPDTVFRQLDNLFLLGLTHKDDIRNVSKNSFTDEDTIQSFATRMPQGNALFMGNVTERYPLIVRIDGLPEGVPPTGTTKSTWDRLIQSAAQG